MHSDRQKIGQKSDIMFLSDTNRTFILAIFGNTWQYFLEKEIATNPYIYWAYGYFSCVAS